MSTPEVTVLRRSLAGNTESLPAAAEERSVALARLGLGTIGRHHASFVQLYYAIEARRSNAMPLVVQFVSPAAGAGASLVAAGYARVAASDSAQPVLFVDCNSSLPQPRRGQKP